MRLSCSACNAEIANVDINVAADLAKCANCGDVHQASKLLRTSEPIDYKPPGGSKISVKNSSSGTLAFTLPRRGLSGALVLQGGFALFWTLFTLVWTIGASQASLIFALFSIPFWVVGVSMLITVVNAASEVQVVILGKHKLTIERQRAIRSKTYIEELKNISTIEFVNMRVSRSSPLKLFRQISQWNSIMAGGIELPAVLSGSHTEHFFEDASDAEQKWVVKLLNAVLQSRKSETIRH